MTTQSTGEALAIPIAVEVLAFEAPPKNPYVVALLADANGEYFKHYRGAQITVGIGEARKPFGDAIPYAPGPIHPLAALRIWARKRRAANYLASQAAETSSTPDLTPHE